MGVSRRLLGIAALLVVPLVLWTTIFAPAIADAAPTRPQRIETGYASTSPVTSVTATVVRVHIPLRAGTPPHPAACDWLSYLRFRSATGPVRSADADRIVVAQPGIFEGAGAFESVARNTVAAAARAGSSVEFWALDRRSNCMEDHTGIAAALRTGSFDTAADYYVSSTPIGGRRFAGFPGFPANGPQYAWLRHQGLEQTLRDQYDLMAAELPDQRMRKQKMVCGGHSLGGFITGFFAEWDFDGNPATTADAGFNQCAGYVALDTGITSDLTSLTGGLALPRGMHIPEIPPTVASVLDTVTGAVDTALPVLALPAVINPETMNLLALTGLAARLAPNGVDDVIRRLPRNLNVDMTLRTLLAKDYPMFLTGTPDVRSLHATNAAVLGAILDDNSQPFGFLQASVGFIGSGPVVAKSFPLPTSLAKRIPLSLTAFGDATKYAPNGFAPGIVYRWRDYDQIDPSLYRYTTPANEVTSIHELARSLSEPPLDFTEWYFPTALPTELSNRNSPTASRHRFYRDAAARAPMITFIAAGGVQPTPTADPRGIVVTLPGYNHIDVLTAAARQNNGRPEQVSTRLAAFLVGLG